MLAEVTFVLTVHPEKTDDRIAPLIHNLLREIADFGEQGERDGYAGGYEANMVYKLRSGEFIWRR